MDVAKKCGCKGIRTCLICEKAGNLTRNNDDEIKATIQYQFCYCCGLCWPVGDTVAGPPLYLSHLSIVPEFVTSEEEEELKVGIDSIEWMPSQSGRKKQDFGPKVNFKKKKSKIGNFNGFPCFAEPLIKRFAQCDDLSDFQPVELCHLDYDPDRGSAIEPHIDDTWIWGERLVTLNLKSPTVLTLTPANKEGPCDCQTHCLNVCSSPIVENGHCLNMSTRSVDEDVHCLNVSASSVDENVYCHNVSASSVDENDHGHNVSACSVDENGHCLNVSESSMDENSHCLNVSASSGDENGRWLNVSTSSEDENGRWLNVSTSSEDENDHRLNVSASSVDENNHCINVPASSMDENGRSLIVSESSVNENDHGLNVSASSLNENDHPLNVSSSSMDENVQCHRHTDVGCNTIEHFTSVASDVIGCQNSSNRIGENGVIESLGCLSKNQSALSNADAVKGSDDHDQPSYTICKRDLCYVNCHNATPGQGDCTITENRHSYLNSNCSKAVDASSVNQHSSNNRSLQTAFNTISLDSRSSNSSENIDQNNFRIPNKFPNCIHNAFFSENESTTIKNMCTVQRIGKERPNIEVLVPLPARSLVVLAGCSRHNWFHEIKRKDIVSRRLAMTFRELARDFMLGGPEEDIGRQLLELGHTFWEASRVDSS